MLVLMEVPMMTNESHAERLRCLALANSIVTAFLQRAVGPEEIIRLTMLGIDLQAAIATGRCAPDAPVSRVATKTVVA